MWILCLQDLVLGLREDVHAPGGRAPRRGNVARRAQPAQQAHVADEALPGQLEAGRHRRRLSEQSRYVLYPVYYTRVALHARAGDLRGRARDLKDMRDELQAII